MGGVEGGGPLGCRALAQLLLHLLQARVDVLVAQRPGGEARVLRQVLAPGDLAKSQPLPVGHQRDAHKTVGRLVDEVDEACRPLDRDRRVHEGLRAHVRVPEEGDDGIEHRDADMLAFAGRCAVQQRGRHRLGGGERRHLVRQDGAHQPRPLLVGARLHGGEARDRLHDGIVCGLGGERPLLAEAAERDIDDVRPDGADIRLADAEPVHHARAKVLDEHVRRRGEPLQQRHALGLFQVQHDGALVAVVVQERRRESALPVAAAARQVPAPRFDLDDVGALVAEDLRRHRPRNHIGEIDHPKPRQRPAHGTPPPCLRRRH